MYIGGYQKNLFHNIDDYPMYVQEVCITSTFEEPPLLCQELLRIPNRSLGLRMFLYLVYYKDYSMADSPRSLKSAA